MGLVFTKNKRTLTLMLHWLDYVLKKWWKKYDQVYKDVNQVSEFFWTSICNMINVYRNNVDHVL